MVLYRCKQTNKQQTESMRNNSMIRYLHSLKVYSHKILTNYQGKDAWVVDAALVNGQC